MDTYRIKSAFLDFSDQLVTKVGQFLDLFHLEGRRDNIGLENTLETFSINLQASVRITTYILKDW